MNLSNLFTKIKELTKNEDVKKTVQKVAENENVKKAVKKAANSKKVKDAVSKAKKTSETISKAAKAVGIDLNSIISLAQKNKAVVEALTKLGLKKESDPASSTVQKLVASLKSNISKAAGVKLEDKTFSSLTTKLLANSNIKQKLENAAGRGVSTFIKKAVEEYISG